MVSMLLVCMFCELWCACFVRGGGVRVWWWALYGLLVRWFACSSFELSFQCPHVIFSVFVVQHVGFRLVEHFPLISIAAVQQPCVFSSWPLQPQPWYVLPVNAEES